MGSIPTASKIMKYDYKCNSCEQIEEVEGHPYSHKLRCSVCGGRLRRVFTAPRVNYNCNGFYSTDNRK